ncbi:universal stress protein [Dinoroseobacter sp. S124A]|uniref:universal stress protein n=1 Tax=Dinoroseobacter sp. S124A TaxID=3415128 RepID=UPI003C7EAD41
MDSICVATDLHGDADRALARAARLAQRHGARLCVVSVLPGTAQDAEISAREATLKAMISQRPEYPSLTVEIVVACGDPVSEVHHAATRCGADLVVVGPHHQGGLLDSMRLTTLEKLVQAAPRPVLLVTAPVEAEYREVLAPVDFSAACAAAVTAARALAPTAEIRLLHAVGVPYQTVVAAPGAVGEITQMVDPKPFVDDAVTQAQDWLAANPALRGLSAPEPDTVALPRLVELAMAAQPADLICLGGHTKQGILDRMLGSFTADMIRKPPCDLLIAPAAG